MKRMICLLFASVLCMILVACGDSSEHIGEAKTPSGSSVMKGRDYESVLETFEEKGFTNIRLEKIADLITGWLTEDGEVEKVTVDGDENYSADKWVNADIEVIIYYHTFADKTDEEETNSSKENSNGSGSFDWMYKDIEEFEFELNSDKSSYCLTKYNELSIDASETATIPSTYNDLPVTKIGSQAFYACEQIKTVIIPDSVTRIGSYAFYHCSDLVNLTIPDSVKQIEEYAFEGCDSLTEFNFPYAISIGFRSFCECENLNAVVIGNAINGTSSVDGYAFYKCTKLESAMLEGVTTIGGKAFQSCDNLTTVTLSGDLIKIGENAFEFCKNLTYIYFNGTPEQWRAIDTWPWWDKDTGDYEVKYS